MPQTHSGRYIHSKKGGRDAVTVPKTEKETLLALHLPHNNQMHWKLDVTGMQDETKPILKDVGLSVPENLICKAMWEKQMQGTYIFLENVDFERFGEKGFEALESRLSNFFLYDELGVKINIVPLTFRFLFCPTFYYVL